MSKLNAASIAAIRRAPPGQRLRVALSMSDTKIAPLAKELSVSREHLSRVVHGSCALTLPLQLKLARALGIAPIELWPALRGLVQELTYGR